MNDERLEIDLEIILVFDGEWKTEWQMGWISGQPPSAWIQPICMSINLFPHTLRVKANLRVKGHIVI